MNESVPSTAFEVPLVATLARLSARPFLLVEPTGNWGDSLIYLGGEALARRAGLDWRRLTVDEFVALPPERDKAVYIHGGGGFNRWCSGKALRALAHAVTHYDGPVINGPMTVDDQDGYVDEAVLPALHRATCAELLIYVRERTSLATLTGRLPAGVELRLDHDTAVQLTVEEALRGTPMRQRYALFALREDDESPANAAAAGFDGVRLDPAMYARSFDHWIRLHALARSVVTNRTHSSILSAVLGKPTTLLGGSYHKNHSVWSYSLRPRGVKWLEWSEAPRGEASPFGALADLPLISRVTRSFKVRRSLNQLRGVPWS